MKLGPAHKRWLPRAMAVAPRLDPDADPGPIRRRYALLINPFYRKDPHASFGKHVLTPSLALTAMAAGTPDHWEVRYWDENLLQGSPPLDPFPEVVAITVHLTFAARAYELARGFDHDDAEVFGKTVEWIEANRLECATFHILTPYPNTPLFGQLEKQGRIVHRDWRLYDTAHVVFEPAAMTAEELLAGYRWCYERLFSHRSIWRRRPRDWHAVPSYLAMSYLYKRANRFWHLLIRWRMTAAIWRPLVELSRRRHLGFRRRLAARACSQTVLTDQSQPASSDAFGRGAKMGA